MKELKLKSLSTLLPGRCVDEIKKEWTTLKTIFLREVKWEEGSKVSGTGTDAVYSSAWQYFKSLLFIKGSDNIDPQTSTLDVDVENVEPCPHKKLGSNKVTLKKWRKPSLSCKGGRQMLTDAFHSSAHYPYLCLK